MRLLLVALCTMYSQYVAPQVNDSLASRKWLVSGGIGITSATSLVLLNELWYSDYEKSPLHSFNDADEWFQIDKAGHLTTNYYLTSLLHPVLKWSGYSDRSALYTGAAISLGYQTTIEIMDGLSAQWGFSWTDQLANTLGAFAYSGQHLLWNEQRIRFKFSYSPTDFANIRPELLGRNYTQRILKDYNGQIYWISVNPSSFMKDDTWFPSWLNVAAGYGGEGMISALDNSFNGITYDRYRQYYLSFDIDLTRIKWKNKWLKSMSTVFSLIKVPLPTVEFAVNRNLEFFIVK
ncbi:MAG: hypothetical protein RL220_962 [Bacteroidota bacterium]|jgi:hypothetical protein